MTLDKDSKLTFPHVLLIDASAGSGKTHTLTQRYIQFLLSDHMKDKHNDLTNILAITFTNNAAREMKQRIIKWLKILALDLKTDENKDQIYALFTLKPKDIHKRASYFIDTLIDRYADFHVQTIDSFMNRILRSSADELGMPPDNDVTDSYVEMTQIAMSNLFAHFGTIIPLDDVDAFLELFNQSQTSFTWNPTWQIKKQFDTFLIQEGRILENIRFQDHWSAAKEKYKELCTLYNEVKSLISQDKIRIGIIRSLGQCDFINFDHSEFFGTYEPECAGLKKNGIKALLAVPGGQELTQQIIQCACELTDKISLSKYTPYGPLYQHFKACLESVKHQTQIIHFDDINKRLSGYVRQEIVPEIYYRLGDMLYHFLLDEFQDTARVQWQNIQPLLEEGYAKGGTLFAVGDMKQAIFMFRKADYRIMRRLGQCIQGDLGSGCLPASVESNARIIPLEHNFRSGSIILDYVDLLFKKRLKDLMPDILAEDRTGLTSYTQNATKEKEGHGYVQTMIIPENKEEEPEKQVLLDIVKDVKKRYPLREIAILTRKNEYVQKIVAWLTEEDIPAASFSSLDIRKRKIVMEISSLLQFLDTPIDDLSFAAFITGDVFLRSARSIDKTITREKIFDLIQGKKYDKKTGYLYRHFREHHQFKNLWEKFLDRLFGIVGYYPLYDLISEIYKTFKVFQNFPEETGFLVQFLEAITGMESRGMGSIKDFTDLVAEEGQASILNIVLPDYIEAVKTMTFHKAKGLGFSVVINLFNKEEKGPGNMFFDPEEQDLYIRYITVNMCKCNKHLKELYDEVKLDNRIQSLNLMYVALTRAKHELYNLIVRKIKKEKTNKDNNAQKKSARKESAPITNAPDKTHPRDIFEDYENGTKEKPTPEKEHPLPTPVIMPGEFEYPFFKDEDKHWSVERLMETQKGDLFHEALADIEYINDDIAEKLSDKIQNVIQRERLSYDPAEIQTTLLKFLELPQVKSWFETQKDRTILRESEFVNEQGASYRMDRVVVDKERIILIDFKTGSTMSFYAAQMKNYRKLLGKAYPGKTIECYFAYVDSGKVEAAS